MRTPFGQLTYCTNIHPGEDWPAHFAALRTHVPPLRAALCRDLPFGIGLRLSDAASRQLEQGAALHQFRDWLQRSGTYVFTLNGFPYGGFHHQRVKEAVHAPDWRSPDRLEYTLRLFRILEAVLPAGMEGGISTSPLCYRFAPGAEDPGTVRQCTAAVLRVAAYLAQRAAEGGAVMHLDIEPEPDGLLDTVRDFIDWYEAVLLPMAGELGLPEEAVRRHITLCLDICHVAVGFEAAELLVDELEEKGIRVGKLQISSALHLDWPEDGPGREAALEALLPFNEPTYLHQVRALGRDGGLRRYPDLPQALAAGPEGDRSWRAHFHVPLFWTGSGPLRSTQAEVTSLLGRQARRPFTRHLEVETYTWEVLPGDDRRPVQESVRTELQWVVKQFNGS